MKAVAVFEGEHRYRPVIVDAPKGLLSEIPERWLAEHDEYGLDVWDYLDIEEELTELEAETLGTARSRAIAYAEDHKLPYLNLN